MRARNGLVVIIGRCGLPFRRDSFDWRAVIVDLKRSPPRLLEIEQFEILTFGQQVHGFMRRSSRHADATQSVHTVPWFAYQAIGVPAMRRAGANIQPPVSVPGPA